MGVFDVNEDGSTPRWDKVQVTTYYITPDGPETIRLNFSRATALAAMQEDYDNKRAQIEGAGLEDPKELEFHLAHLGPRPESEDDIPNYEEQVQAAAQRATQSIVPVTTKQSNKVRLIPAAYTEVEVLDVASIILAR